MSAGPSGRASSTCLRAADAIEHFVNSNSPIAGTVVWLTGLSGAGKSTIALALERELRQKRTPVYVLDGDKVRTGLCSDLGFSPEDRKENIRRIAEVARLFADAGLICVVAFISPYRSDRDRARAMLPAGKFIEVYLSTPLEVCEERDVKGLYAKARAGLVSDFTGISAPYEAPLRSELELRTDKLSLDQCVYQVVGLLTDRGALKS